MKGCILPKVLPGKHDDLGYASSKRGAGVYYYLSPLRASGARDDANRLLRDRLLLQGLWRAPDPLRRRLLRVLLLRLCPMPADPT